MAWLIWYILQIPRLVIQMENVEMYIMQKSPYPWNKWTATSAQKRVNDDRTNTFQGYATITSKKVGKDSVLITAWEDDRNSIVVGEPNLIYDVYSATINKDGVISPNSRVTDTSSRSDFSFIGDYFDISYTDLLNDKTAYVIWTDRRDKTDIMDLEDDVAMNTLKLNDGRCMVGTSHNNDDELTGSSLGNSCIDIKGADDLFTGPVGNNTLSGDKEKDILEQEIGNGNYLVNDANFPRHQN